MEAKQVTVKSDDYEGPATLLRTLDPDEFDGDGATCYEVRTPAGDTLHVFDYELA